VLVDLQDGLGGDLVQIDGVTVGGEALDFVGLAAP
jgi:hypothetical protein